MPNTLTTRRHTAYASAAILAGMTGPVLAQNRPAAPKDLMDQFAAAIVARDAAQIAGFYSEQSMLMTPQGNIIHGRDRIREVYARNFASGQPPMRLINARSDGGPEAGVVIWIWEMEIPRQGQPPQRRRVRSMLYLKNSPSGWRVVADMFQVFAAEPG